MNRRLLTVVAGTALVSVLGTLLITGRMPLDAAAAAQPQETSVSPPDAARMPADGRQQFPDLMRGLQSTPGCMGIEAARTRGGKNVIFAWFKDKQSVLKWYYSDMHQQVMEQFFPDQEFDKPMQGVPDDIGPLLTIASITMSEKSSFDQTTLPVSQIAIELYRPVTGGLFLGGRFAPDDLKVPELQDYTPNVE